jgi:hypothetical protein
MEKKKRDLWSITNQKKNPAHDAKKECGRIFTAPERKKQGAFETFRDIQNILP